VQKYFIEARSLLALAIPVIIAQISQTAMGVVDTIMAGSYSATDMAAVAVGTSIWLPTILFGHGLLLALTPVIAQLNGAGRRDRIAYQVRQGFWLASGVSLLIIAVIYNSQLVIDMMHNIDPLLAEKPLVSCMPLCGELPAICSSRSSVANVKAYPKPSPAW
jgi:MATE family multidrug resistance protein